jgi:hypothetical protein
MGWANLPGQWWPSWATGLGGTQAQRLQGFMAQFLPYVQAYQQQQQWGQEFDWRKAMDQWSQQFQGEQFDWQKAADLWGQGMQEQMFGWEQEQGKWGQEFQQEQLDWQKLAEEQRLGAEREAANLQAFGRRWRPSTRWS